MRVRARTILLLSALVGLLAIVGVVVLWHHELVRSRNDALVRAADDGDLERVQELLRAGASADARGSDINTETALMRAAARGHLEIVRTLLAHGAAVDARHVGRGELRGRTALMFAVANSRKVEVIQFLLDRGADVSVKDALGESPLTLALKSKDVPLAQLLVERGADVNATDRFGRPALISAIKLQRPSFGAPSPVPALVRAMLEHGADVEAKDSGLTTLSYTEPVGFGATAVATETNADPGVADRTALMVAVQTGNIDIVKALLAKGADVNAKDSTGKTALLLATAAMRQDLIDLLKKAGAKE
jgi:ankyrin repeat protein